MENSNERSKSVAQISDPELKAMIDAEVLKDVMENWDRAKKIIIDAINIIKPDIRDGSLVNGFVGFTVEYADEHRKYIGAIMMKPEEIALWMFNEIELRPDVKEHFMNIMMCDVVEKLKRKTGIRIDE